MENTKIWIFLLVLICIIDKAYSIKCWECRSMDDPKCADPFDNSTLSTIDCDQKSLPHLPGAKSTMCRKIRQKFLGEWKYFRSCAFMGEPGLAGDERFCLMRTGTFNIFSEYCTCSGKDGCNSSNIISPLSSLMTISILLISFLMKKLLF